jgi:hypothetical protein
MNKHNITLGAAVLLALFATGCESDGGIAARTQEKSAVYATLKISDKRFIEKGVIAMGFTSDMVYMAMGHPTKVESKDLPQGRAELWTYDRYYPNYDAGHGFKFANFTTESAYQPQPPQFQDQPNYNPENPNRPKVPIGMANNILPFVTGGPQGSSMEPADLQSFKFVILFENGKVARFGATPNPI